MAKKIKPLGFPETIDLDYQPLDNPSTDNKGNKLAAYSFAVNPTAVARYQFQPLSAASLQRFQIVKIYASALAETSAGVPIALVDFRFGVLVSPGGSNVQFPAGLFSDLPSVVGFPNQFARLSDNGNPQNKQIMIDCGDGTIVNPNETVTFDFYASKAAAFAITDVIYVSVKMIWK